MVTKKEVRRKFVPDPGTSVPGLVRFLFLLFPFLDSSRFLLLL